VIKVHPTVNDDDALARDTETTKQMTVGQFTIRDASVDDVGELAQVFRDASLSNEKDRPNLLAHPDSLVFDGQSVRTGDTIVAVADRRIIGFASAVPAGSFLELEDLFVRPERQREGVGLALVNDVLTRAAMRGFGQLRVTANPHAMAFYLRAGFVKVGMVETRFGSGTRMERPV
jgi:GNAT superfamily N-acetyltransferase